MSLFRLRKLSKAFQKGSPTKHPESSPTKPVYRGTKPLTVADIHSHSPVEKTRIGDIDYYYDEMGTRRSPPRKPVPEKTGIIDILDDFPAPPPLKAVISNDYHDGPRFYFTNDDLFYPDDDLLPPPPDKVLEMVKEREHIRMYEARREQQRTVAHSPAVPPGYSPSSQRRPLYANSHANMSTRSLGVNSNFKAAPIAQRAMVQQPVGHNSSAQRVTPPSRPSPRSEGRQQLYTIPEGHERKRLRSAPTQLSARQRAAANEELYQAYPSNLHGRF